MLIDADDTLWENNVYFERVIRVVQDMLAPWHVSAEAFRERLNQKEAEHIRTDGYGTVNFARSLVAVFEGFLPPGAGSALSRRVKEMALDIMNAPVELLDGVVETLEYLHRRHDLYLVTKGSAEEQARKIENSGVLRFFRGVEILAEKSPPAYAQLLKRHGWDPGRTWMVGNSPRSDINPSLQAGMNAVYVPHAHTWILEHEEPVRHPRLLELRSFRDLWSHF